MGTGKSTIAALLEKKLERTAVLEIEDVRELISDFQRGKVDNALAWNVIYRMCDEYFKNGVSVLLEQTVCSPDMVNKYLLLAKKHGCTVRFYHLRAPKQKLLKRINARKKDRHASKALTISNIEKHEKINYIGATVIDTEKMKPTEVVKLILKDLKKS